MLGDTISAWGAGGQWVCVLSFSALRRYCEPTAKAFSCSSLASVLILLCCPLWVMMGTSDTFWFLVYSLLCRCYLFGGGIVCHINLRRVHYLASCLDRFKFTFVPPAVRPPESNSRFVRVGQCPPGVNEHDAPVLPNFSESLQSLRFWSQQFVVLSQYAGFGYILLSFIVFVVGRFLQINQLATNGNENKVFKFGKCSVKWFSWIR